MSLFRKPVKLLGGLGRDAGVPPSGTANDGCLVLALLVESITSDRSTDLQIARTLQVPVICPGPDFCCVTRDMKEGDFIEVEGELRLSEEDGPVVWTREPRVMRVAGIKVRATGVAKIDCIDADEDG